MMSQPGHYKVSDGRTTTKTMTKMWRGVRQAGVLFDVDGVLLRGGAPIPAARRALRKLLDADGHFLFPVVFVTNAGSCQRHHKALQLTRLLEVKVTPEQVVLSHSPLRLLERFHGDCVLASGQGPVDDIARSLGFRKVLTLEQIQDQHPDLDMVDHSRTPRPPSSPSPTLPKIQAIVLFGEPIRWESSLQLLVDVLLTDGRPGAAYRPAAPAPQLPVLACNVDLTWMAAAPSPRFGHGVFLLCLEAAYRKLTGRELRYEALLGKPGVLTYRYAERVLTRQNRGRRVSTIYAIGDNPTTDIYGANLYNRYLGEQHAAVTAATNGEPVARGTGGQEEESAAARCRSILVCTGVYSPGAPDAAAAFHGHRDLQPEPHLVTPDHVVEDVEAAVDLMLQQEGL